MASTPAKTQSARKWTLGGPSPYTPLLNSKENRKQLVCSSPLPSTPRIQQKLFFKRSLRVDRWSQKGEGTIIGSTFVLVQSIIGGGLLAYPAGYHQAGLGGMILLQALLMVFVAIGLRMLAFCTEYCEADTYQSMVKRILGPTAESVCCMVVLIISFGACVVYIDVVVDQLVAVCRMIAKCDPVPAQCAAWYAERTLLLSLTCGLMFFCSLVRSISKLAGAAALGFIAMVYVTIVITSEYATTEPLAPATRYWFRSNAGDWLGAMPVICFSFQGHMSAVPLYAEMSQRSIANFDRVIALALSVCLVLYNITGVAGYLSFGAQTQGDVLLNLRPGHPLVRCALVAVAVAVAVSYTILQYCARTVLLEATRNVKCACSSGKSSSTSSRISGSCSSRNSISGNSSSSSSSSSLSGSGFLVSKSAVHADYHSMEAMEGGRQRSSSANDGAGGNGSSRKQERKQRQQKPGKGGDIHRLARRHEKRVRFMLVTLLWTITVFIVALVAPNIGRIVSIIGNFSSFFMFHFPGLCYIAIAFKDRPWTWHSAWDLETKDRPTLAIGMLMFVLGIFVFVLGSGMSAYNLVSGRV